MPGNDFLIFLDQDNVIRRRWNLGLRGGTFDPAIGARYRKKLLGPGDKVPAAPPARSPESRTRHGKVKFAVQLALYRAIQRAGLQCHMLPDSSGIRISQHMMHIPDALVYCGPELPGDALEVPNPVIVAEVLSPSTRKFDETVKLNGYFSLPSVHHYLIVDPDGPSVVHHSRQPDGTILRSVVHEGSITLSPPGIELGVAELLAAA